MDNYREKKLFNIVCITQWIMIALLFLYIYLPGPIPRGSYQLYFFLSLGVIFALIYSKLPEEIYIHPKFFFWTSFIYQASLAFLVFYTGGAQSHLHWLFLLPILYMSVHYGMRDGLISSLVSSILLLTVCWLDPEKPALFNLAYICIERISVFVGTAIFVGAFANEEIRERRELEIFRDLSSSKQLSSDINLKTIMKQAIQNVTSYLNADSSCLMLLDKEAKQVRTEACTNWGDSMVRDMCVDIGEGVAGQVAKTELPLLLHDIQEENLSKLHLCDDKLRSLLAVPLKVGRKVVGVLHVGSYHPRSFNKDDLRRLSALAGETAVCIYNAQLFTQIEEVHLDTIKALITSIEAKDSYTRGHSERVTSYVLAISEALNLSRAERDLLRTASLLHDIGKLGIDERILLKKEGLNDDERETIKTHPSIGAQILGSGSALRETIPLVLYHHEHFDGSGYPVGLKGHSIPLGSRILGIADAFEAMTSDRPYRQALNAEEAVTELRKKAGSQFDPRIVEIFVKLVESDKLVTVQKSIKKPKTKVSV